MSENVEWQYDKVVSYIDSYNRFRSSILARFFTLHPRVLMHPRVLLRSAILSIKLWRKLNVLSGRLPDDIKTMISNNATQEERENPYYDVAVSDYPLHALNERLKSDFSYVDFSVLKEHHDTKVPLVSRFALRPIVATVLAVVGAIVALAPKEVVTNLLSIEYSTFRIA